MSYYDILGVPYNASQEEIKRAYRDQIKFFHPDVFKGPPEVAKIKSAQLNEAYAVLSNPEKKRIYDFNLWKDQQKRKEQANRERQEQQSKQEEKDREEKREEKQNNTGENQETSKTRRPNKKTIRNCAVFLALCVFCLFVYVTSNLYEEKAAWERKYNEKVELLEQQSHELEFWKKYAVIVVENSEKYHTYGCQYIKGKDFWIYNKENADLLGYEPRSICNPPEVK